MIPSVYLWMDAPTKALRGNLESHEPPKRPEIPRETQDAPPEPPWHSRTGYRVAGAALVALLLGYGYRRHTQFVVTGTPGEGAEQKVGDRLNKGARVRTGPLNRLQLVQPEGTLALERSTEATLGDVVYLHRGVVSIELGATRSLDADWFNVTSTTPGGDSDQPGPSTPSTPATSRSVANITVGEQVASVEAMHGAVTVRAHGREFRVEQGREAILNRESERVDVGPGRLQVASHREGKTVEGTLTGELRAKKPGASDEQARALKIGNQEVHVTLAGPVARTEIEQTFVNDSGEELEGMYRFPLPAQASFEGLALEVDGRWMEGEFVDVDRARGIWKGAIQHAITPDVKPKSDIVWVPGPWHDPALLEWQRGGRFELRIFPIPKHGSRKVKIRYTESLPLSQGKRQYALPFPTSGASIDHMRVDVQTLGTVGAEVDGYTLNRDASGDSEHFTRTFDAFEPKGNLTITVNGPKSVATTYVSAGDSNAILKKNTFALALRPQAPLPKAVNPVHHVIVVDTGRGMLGARYKQAIATATRMIETMDRRDRVSVMACDLTCQTKEVFIPSGRTARETEQFLTDHDNEGATNIAASVEKALDLPLQAGFTREVVLLTNGYGGAGAKGEARLKKAPENARVVTVALGSDGDQTFLESIARQGHGVFVRHLASEAPDALASRILETSQGSLMTELEMEWPSGVQDVAPAHLAPIVQGGEIIVSGRLATERVKGDAFLRGRVNGVPFETKVPLDLNASDAKAAFVPRLYAAARVRDLEESSAPSAKQEAIMLSQSEHVPSKYTSLLVLESAAMFDAFGIARTDHTAARELGGDQGTDSAQQQKLGNSAGFGGLAAPPSPAASVAAVQAAPKAARASSGTILPDADLSGRGAGGASEQRADKPKKEALAEAEGAPAAFDDARRVAPQERASRPMFRRARPMIAARRIYVHHATIEPVRVEQDDKALETLRSDAVRDVDNRDKRARLCRKLAALGMLDELARELHTWEGRDPFDVELLALRAELSMQRGNKEEALRRYSSILAVPTLSSVDMPRWAERVAHAFAVENSPHACALQLGAAEVKGNEEAIRMAQNCSIVPSNDVTTVDKPELRVSLDDASRSLVDLLILDSEGRLIDPVIAQSVDAQAESEKNGLAFKKVKMGTYTIVLRSRGSSDTKGKVSIHAFGSQREVPFDLTGKKLLQVATARLAWQAVLVDPETGEPMSDPWGVQRRRFIE